MIRSGRSKSSRGEGAVAQPARPAPLRRVALTALVVAVGVLDREASAQIYATSLFGTDLSLFGHSLTKVGDVDGDGVDDLLVGEPNYSSGGLTGIGRVDLYSGATMTFIREHDGATTYDYFGWNVAPAGDFDGDGFADYAVGAPWFDVGGTVDAGEAVVYSGATGAVLLQVQGTVAGSLTGYVVAAPGDLDGDGAADLLVSAMKYGDVSAYDHSGHFLYGIAGYTGAEFGYTLATGSDLDGDGVPDWFAGAPLESTQVGGTTYYQTGAVYALSGANGNTIYRYGGYYQYDFFGESLARLGDLDGDGIDDVIAGSPDSSSSVTELGMVVVFSGAAGTTLFNYYGSAAYDQLGASVTGLPDMNHDGVPDFAFGAPGVVDFFVTRGQAQVCSGKDGAQLASWVGSGGFKTGNYALGTSIAGGDWNGDGIGDVVSGDPDDVVQYSDRTYHQLGEAIEWLGCPAWWENYGSGWPGKNGVPALTALNDPSPGLPLTIQVDSSLGSQTLGVLFLGFAEANVPTGKGGTLLVSPAQTIPIVIPATGLQMSSTIPNDPALDFFDLYLQAIEADAFASKGLSFTAGLRLRFGLDLP
jgi:hypothetical protein